MKVDKFYYPVDFVILDTEPIANEPNHVPIILGRPFLATANAIINCRNGVMQLTFGNMTLELNIFNLKNKYKLMEDENQVTDEVCSVGQDAEKLSVQELQEMANQSEADDLVLPSVPTAGQLFNSESISENKSTKGKPTPRNQLRPLPGLRRSSSLTLLE